MWLCLTLHECLRGYILNKAEYNTKNLKESQLCLHPSFFVSFAHTSPHQSELLPSSCQVLNSPLLNAAPLSEGIAEYFVCQSPAAIIIIVMAAPAKCT